MTRVYRKVQYGLAVLAESGVTDFAASEFTTNADEKSLTLELLKNWKASS